jgi:hypothetical protein
MNPDSNTYRHAGERSELVERVIHLERRLRVYEQAQRAGDVGDRNQLSWLIARVEELESIVARQNELISRRKTA